MARIVTAAALTAILGTISLFGQSATGNVEKREFVCMMQDMVLTKPGIALQYEGRTYYGCCEMCKDKIKSEPKKYTRAVDPVSAKSVDKAGAFIYALGGDAFYFLSEANRKAFAENPQKYLNR